MIVLAVGRGVIVIVIVGNVIIIGIVVIVCIWIGIDWIGTQTIIIITLRIIVLRISSIGTRIGIIIRMIMMSDTIFIIG